jgi:hypothetical protein
MGRLYSADWNVLGTDDRGHVGCETTDESRSNRYTPSHLTIIYNYSNDAIRMPPGSGCTARTHILFVPFSFFSSKMINCTYTHTHTPAAAPAVQQVVQETGVAYMKVYDAYMSVFVLLYE